LKIIVTGSNGLLGQKLIQLLAGKANVELLATSKGKNRFNRKEGYRYQSLDITNRTDVLAVVAEFQPDALINTAAMTNVDACELDKERCWDLNVNAVKHLIEAAKQSNTHLIHLSTDFIFDGAAGPYKEEDEPNPLSYYGQSKYQAEQLLAGSTIKWSIARTIIVYGVVPDMSRSNVVLWAKEALEKGTPLTIVEDQFRTPTFAEDLAMGCYLIAEKKAEGIYHLSGKDAMSILDLVYKVADFYGLDQTIVTPIQSSALNQTAKRPTRTGFILDKAMTDLGYNPKSFEEGLIELTKQLES